MANVVGSGNATAGANLIIAGIQQGCYLTTATALAITDAIAQKGCPVVGPVLVGESCWCPSYMCISQLVMLHRHCGTSRLPPTLPAHPASESMPTTTKLITLVLSLLPAALVLTAAPGVQHAISMRVDMCWVVSWTVSSSHLSCELHSAFTTHATPQRDHCGSCSFQPPDLLGSSTLQVLASSPAANSCPSVVKQSVGDGLSLPSSGPLPTGRLKSPLSAVILSVPQLLHVPLPCSHSAAGGLCRCLQQRLSLHRCHVSNRQRLVPGQRPVHHAAELPHQLPPGRAWRAEHRQHGGYCSDSVGSLKSQQPDSARASTMDGSIAVQRAPAQSTQRVSRKG